MKTELGKISAVRFGYCGYQDLQFGLSLTFEGKGFGVGHDITYAWSLDMECDEYCKWTEEDRDKGFAKIMREINEVMQKAKVHDVTKLKGIPVEITFDGNMLKSWRVLEEVL